MNFHFAQKIVKISLGRIKDIFWGFIKNHLNVIWIKIYEGLCVDKWKSIII